jgi:hypothetical protein
MTTLVYLKSKIFRGIEQAYYALLTIISPTLNTKARYKKAFHKKLNLKDPKTFNEKLLWLKLSDYIRNPLVIQCVDKYAVRDYIKDCGCEDILNELIGVWEKPTDIPWDELPEQFVLKWNFGAGMNIICKDKSQLDVDHTVKQLSKWGKNRYWLPYSEMQYKYMHKRIICEKFLSDRQHEVIPDYKVYCFNGKPQAIFVMMGRGTKVQTMFFDTEWNPLENSAKYGEISEQVEKPLCLEQLIGISEKLSKPFPFVRCDFYVVNNQIYFGELTFTPAGGLYTSQTSVHGKDMGELLNIM